MTKRDVAESSFGVDSQRVRARAHTNLTGATDPRGSKSALTARGDGRVQSYRLDGLHVSLRQHAYHNTILIDHNSKRVTSSGSFRPMFGGESR
jgi:hypothetical protein